MIASLSIARVVAILFIASLGILASCSSGEPDPAPELEALLSETSPNLGRIRHLLLSMEHEGVAFLTNRFQSSDYQTASRALEILCYAFAGDTTEKGRAFVTRAMPAFISCLSAESQPLRSRALWLIGDLGAQAEPALDTLLEVASQPESGRFVIKRAAIKSIGEIGCRPDASLPFLESLLDHDDPEVVRFAIIAIGRFESHALSLIPRLQMLIQAGNENIAKAAGQAIDRMQLPPKPKAGDRAPNFILPTASGERTVQLRDQRGKLVLLDFWATTCPPCMAPLAKYENLVAQNAKKWKDKVEVIAISMDPEIDPVRRHLAAKGWTNVTHLWGGNQDHPSRAYRVRAVPDTLLIDEHGVILWRGHPTDLDFATQAQGWLEQTKN